MMRLLRLSSSIKISCNLNIISKVIINENTLNALRFLRYICIGYKISDYFIFSQHEVFFDWPKSTWSFNVGLFIDSAYWLDVNHKGICLTQ